MTEREAAGGGAHVFGEEGTRLGRVVVFDREAGLGTVRDRDGRDYPFHCTEVADGSRQVDVGADVVFRARPGRLGRWEARELRAPA